MSDGQCVADNACPAASDTYSEWGAWTACTSTCAGGARSRSRMCLASSCTGQSWKSLNFVYFTVSERRPFTTLVQEIARK